MRTQMQTIDEVREDYRFVVKGVEKMVADGEKLRAKLIATQPPYLYKSGGR